MAAGVLFRGARSRLLSAPAVSSRLLSTSAAVQEAVAPRVPLLIGGKFVDSSSTSPDVPVRNPATQKLLAMTPIATQEEMKAAVDAAKAAFPSWSGTSVSNRARVMFKLQALIRQHEEELAAILSAEHGKTIDDAKGDIFRGLEVVEHACSITSLQMGETVPGVAGSTDVHSYRLPLGVCAGIAPFNFPAMIPLWMFPMGVVTGNTYVLKPSERVPMTAMRLAELAMEAGLPDGVLNIIHGTHDAVNFICDDPDIKAISFVGGDAAGKHIYSRGARRPAAARRPLEEAPLRSSHTPAPAHLPLTAAAHRTLPSPHARRRFGQRQARAGQPGRAEPRRGARRRRARRDAQGARRRRLRRGRAALHGDLARDTRRWRKDDAAAAGRDGSDADARPGRRAAAGWKTSVLPSGGAPRLICLLRTPERSRRSLEAWRGLRVSAQLAPS